ncbi:MAG: hypothetical protein KDA93_15555 [Planctomycetaceae bacterium]|nr:hypothetical protein [Planctomycetaceae bacterium]
MELFQNLSDDQTALIGCFAALVASGLLMSVSYYVGQWNQSDKVTTHRLPQRQADETRKNKAA